MVQLLAYILSCAYSIVLPFGFTFGAFIIMLWSLPLIIRFIKSIF